MISTLKMRSLESLRSLGMMIIILTVCSTASARVMFPSTLGPLVAAGPVQAKTNEQGETVYQTNYHLRENNPASMHAKLELAILAPRPDNIYSRETVENFIQNKNYLKMEVADWPVAKRGIANKKDAIVFFTVKNLSRVTLYIDKYKTADEVAKIALEAFEYILTQIPEPITIHQQIKQKYTAQTAESELKIRELLARADYEEQADDPDIRQKALAVIGRELERQENFSVQHSFRMMPSWAQYNMPAIDYGTSQPVQATVTENKFLFDINISNNSNYTFQNINIWLYAIDKNKQELAIDGRHADELNPSGNTLITFEINGNKLNEITTAKYSDDIIMRAEYEVCWTKGYKTKDHTEFIWEKGIKNISSQIARP